MRSKVLHLAARIHGVAHPRDRHPPRGEEATTFPTLRSLAVIALSTPTAEVVVALSTLELSQDHRATVNLAPIAVQPPPFLALESVPRLGEKSCRPSTPEIADSMPGIADRKSDCRPSILEFAAERSLRRNRPREYRPSLPARRSVREEAAVPSADRKHKPKQSRALTQVQANFVQSRTQSRVTICFSRTILKFQNTSHS
ncbi:hypothetical protein B296_00045339 [Ensete ventricosum]|uniref:Uncharacterized protein n=1 Tax=Ensete ventricosum TaxID=4639 RepID=A0A426XWB3_ENSVE|nr:hypothetical protein B296_00045339 [Ensete ventricosum]